MQSEELERIRLLQNRMRRPSRLGNHGNEESLKSIKSTDSKKVAPVLVKLQEEYEEPNQHEESHQHCHIKLSQEEIKCNRKITDYFPFKKAPVSPLKRQSISSPQVTQTQNIQGTNTQSPLSPDEKSNRVEMQQSYREQVRLLRDRLKEKDQLLNKFRNDIVESTIKMHRIKRNQLKQKISSNKVRLGEYLPDGKGKEHWVDGIQIRNVKQRVEALRKEKQQLEKSKRQARRGKQGEETQQWKISLASQTHFLVREEVQLQETLNRLEEEKAIHIKEYRLIYEEDRSRYGRLEAETNAWPRIRKYQLLGLLGKGGFSEVYKGLDTELLQEVAIKIHEFHSTWNATAKQNYLKHALRENQVQKMLSHPNIVQLHDTVQIDGSSFCTVLQFCEGPDLSIYLKKHKKIPQKQAKLIIRQVVNAIKYLHQLPDKVIHYDLKPQNILFHKGRIKITDFGLCKTTKEERIELTSQGVGTYWYLPPQCFVNDQKAVISPKVDVWSIGVIYYEMLYGEKPFGHQMSQIRILNQGIMLKAVSVNFPNTQKGLISNESKQFIKECLTFHADQRLDIRGVAAHKVFDKK